MTIEIHPVAEHITVELSRPSPRSVIYRLETFQKLQSDEHYIEIVIHLKK